MVMVDIQTLYFLYLFDLNVQLKTTFRNMPSAYAAVRNWEGLKNAPTVMDP